MIIGYTSGVYDLFHVGHLNLLKNAKGLCDKLIVGVTVDELVSYKGKKAFIPFEDRIEIVRSIKYVDAAVPQYDMDKVTMCKKLGANILFVGDDWYATDKWKKYEEDLKKEGIKVIYFPYTKGVSSTLINNALLNLREKKEKNMIDKNFCMSSFLAFRYIEKPNVNFYKGLTHENLPLIEDSKRVFVSSAQDIDRAIQKEFDALKNEKLGIMLSGGMDSACLASYMPGCDAYTFRFLGGRFGQDELKRAEMYAHKYHLKLHYVDIDWNVVTKYLDVLMKAKGAPVHSIEPQIMAAALQAKADGITKMIIGDSSDPIFGGMDGLLSKDWTFDEFVKRYTFTDPKEILNEPVDVNYLFERYRKGNHIDFLRFMDEVYAIESSGSYENAFNTAKLSYLDPYIILKMKDPLDLNRVRNGESKYLIRQLFKMKYPEIPVPNKTPMPRPVDEYFKDWKGPTRPEFRKDIDMSKLTGNQKWQLFALERFLNLYENR